MSVPEGLADQPPGPGLAAVLAALPLDRVSNDAMLPVLLAQYRQLCHEQARMIAVIGELGRCAGSAEPGQVRRTAEPLQYAADETRAALRWTRHAAECEHALADSLDRMPPVFDAWLAGDIDRQRVRVFDRHLADLTDAQVSRICRLAVPQAPKLTTGQLAALLRRMVIAVDPEAAARWYRRGIQERNVIAFPAADGTITISANGLPADEAEAACVRLQDIAAAAKRAGHPGPIGQIRCDVFLGMLDGRFHRMTCEQVVATLIADYRPAGPAGGPGPSAGPTAEPPTPEPLTPEPPTPEPPTPEPPTPEPPASKPLAPGPPVGPRLRPSTVGDDRRGIEIRVGLATVLGLDEHPGEIPGLGLLPAADSRHRVARQLRAQWRFAVTDSAGQLLTEGYTRARPRLPGTVTGPPGGIVELHVPLSVLRDLVRAGPSAQCGWGSVIADIARQHSRRWAHLAKLDSRSAARFPHPALRRHTEIRDRTCTFPGCRHPAHRAQLDHTRDHCLGGPTIRANLGPVCGHDHDLKHEGGWWLDQPEPGIFVWHSPLGGRYVTRGEFLQPPMPEPTPPAPTPDADQPASNNTWDVPILRRRSPPRPQPPPPRTGHPENPDEPPPF